MLPGNYAALEEKYGLLKKKMLTILEENDRIVRHLERARRKNARLHKKIQTLRADLRLYQGVTQESKYESSDNSLSGGDIPIPVRNVPSSVTGTASGGTVERGSGGGGSVNGKTRKMLATNDLPLPNKRARVDSPLPSLLDFHPNPNIVLPPPSAPTQPAATTTSGGPAGSNVGGGLGGTQAPTTSTKATKQGGTGQGNSGGSSRSNASTGNTIPGPRPRRGVGHGRSDPVRKLPKFPMHTDGSPSLPMQLGILLLIKLGRVESTRVRYHTAKYIFPIGYTVQRTYPSLLYSDRHTTFTCSIEDGGDTPKFVLTPADQPDQPIVSSTPTGAWTTAMRRANDLRNRSTTNSASGPEYFGLTNPVIIYLIQNLPGASQCVDYVPVTFDTVGWDLDEKRLLEAAPARAPATFPEEEDLEIAGSEESA